MHRPGPVLKVIRQIRGEGLLCDYRMDDGNCKERYDCTSAFTTWRWKHHHRICGQIFCSRCALNIKGSRFGHEGMLPTYCAPLHEGSDGTQKPIRDNLAPFRRGLSDEGKDPGSVPLTPVDALTIVGPKHPVKFPTSFPAGGEGTMSFVEFPVGSLEHDRGSPHPHSHLRSRFNSYGGLKLPRPSSVVECKAGLTMFPLGSPAGA
ncbi:hypothetical protein BD779DRAFT_1479189 [Infundibulicybe gibba]|nr:hypothetical protein BD779DRAFT_1479189 [Infundibulicybe gibba]